MKQYPAYYLAVILQIFLSCAPTEPVTEPYRSIYNVNDNSDAFAWTWGSPPFAKDSLLTRPPCWNFLWFTPVEQDTAYWIAPPEGWTKILTLVCIASHKSLVDNYMNPWCGVRSTLLLDSADSGYTNLELLIKVQAPVSFKGILYVDFGKTSEDICINGGPPNGIQDFEEIIGYADATDDKGLDGILNDSEEIYLIPNIAKNGWDTLRYGSDSLPDPEDPSGDNYDTTDIVTRKRTTASRSQYDAYIQGEDVNRNGFETAEDVYRVAIDLNNMKQSSYFKSDSTFADSWTAFSIPLDSTSNAEKIGNPDWTSLKSVRIWWSDYGGALIEERILWISAIELVRK